MTPVTRTNSLLPSPAVTTASPQAAQNVTVTTGALTSQYTMHEQPLISISSVTEENPIILPQPITMAPYQATCRSCVHYGKQLSIVEANLSSLKSQRETKFRYVGYFIDCWQRSKMIQEFLSSYLEQKDSSTSTESLMLQAKTHYEQERMMELPEEISFSAWQETSTLQEKLKGIRELNIRAPSIPESIHVQRVSACICCDQKHSKLTFLQEEFKRLDTASTSEVVLQYLENISQIRQRTNMMCDFMLGRIKCYEPEATPESLLEKAASHYQSHHTGPQNIPPRLPDRIIAQSYLTRGQINHQPLETDGAYPYDPFQSEGSYYIA